MFSLDSISLQYIYKEFPFSGKNGFYKPPVNLVNWFHACRRCYLSKKMLVDFVGTQDDLAEKYGFEKVSEQFIQECKSKAVLYKHKKTGAEVMSVSNDDENKVFGIVFRTPP